MDDESDGERVPTGRLERILKMGSMGARVGVSSLTSKVRSYLSPGEESERQEQLARAFEANAEHVVEVLGELKGASMKIGQLLSMDPELLPEGFSDVVASLQEEAPPMAYETIVEQIESNLGRDVDAIFDYFDPEPIGAASIGQVHRGRLADGTDVAVKIQYPGVVESLESDLRTLRQLLVLGRVAIDGEQLDAYFEELRRIVLEEADYVREAENMATFADLFDDREGIDCPRPIEEWTTGQVLVMELARGESFEAALRQKSPDERREILERWIETYLWMLHEEQMLHGDPHPGNFLWDDGEICFLDFGCAVAFDSEFTDGHLELLVACWNHEERRAVELYDQLGFSDDRRDVGDLDPELLRAYHEIIVAPFLAEGRFDFGSWNPTMRAKKFMLRHPSFFALVPPRQALMCYRVLTGVKGLLSKLDVSIDVRTPTEAVARRRGLLD